MGQLQSLVRMLFQSPSRSIGAKLFLIFFCFTGLSVGGLGVFSSSIARTAIVDQMKSSSLTTISLAGEKLDMKQQFYVDISSQLIHNSSFTKHLFQITAAGIGADELQRRVTDIRSLFDQLALSDPSIRDITLIPIEDSLPIISTVRENVDPKLADAAWISDVKKANGKPVWMPIVDKGYLGDAPKPLFAYGRVIGQSNVGSREFILLVQVEAKVLQSMIEAFKLSEGAETLIVTASGKPVISSKEGHSQYDPQDSVVQTGSGSLTYSGRDGQERLAAYRYSPSSDWTFVGIAPLSELTRSVKQIQGTTYLFIASNLLIAFLLGLWIVTMVGRPLSQMLQYMQNAARGNLTGRLRFDKNKDEIGQVALAFNQMVEQIGRLIVETRITVTEVAVSSAHMTTAARETDTSAKEIHAAADQIAHGAVDLAAHASEGTSWVEQMSSRLSEVLALQSLTSGSAREVHEVCRQGGHSVNQLIRKTEDTETSLRRVSEKVNGLYESAQSVQSILKLMTDIANQTKILSLNASIEATRAGLAGAGFKVISNEIRQLAERSNASIGQVGDLTMSIQGEVGSTVQALSKALPFFQDLTHEVHSVHHLFSLIQGQMEELITRSTDVTRSLTQLNETQLSLIGNMNEVSAVSEESSAATEQVASLCTAQLTIGTQLVELSDRMKQMSAKLEQHMNGFQVD